MSSIINFSSVSQEERDNDNSGIRDLLWPQSRGNSQDNNSNNSNSQHSELFKFKLLNNSIKNSNMDINSQDLLNGLSFDSQTFGDIDDLNASLSMPNSQNGLDNLQKEFSNLVDTGKRSEVVAEQNTRVIYPNPDTSMLNEVARNCTINGSANMAKIRYNEYMERNGYENNQNQIDIPIANADGNLQMDFRQLPIADKNIIISDFINNQNNADDDNHYPEKLYFETIGLGLPSISQWEGNYDFYVYPVEESNQRRCLYAREINKIFCIHSQPIQFCFLVKWNLLMSSSNMSIVSELVFSTADKMGTPITRCFMHRNQITQCKLQAMNILIQYINPHLNELFEYIEFISENSLHVLLSENIGAEYFQHPETKRCYVKESLEKPLPGEESIYRNFLFMCNNSCKNKDGEGGMDRRDVALVFSLLKNEKVVGRSAFKIKICTCPGRDYDKEVGVALIKTDKIALAIIKEKEDEKQKLLKKEMHKSRKDKRSKRGRPKRQNLPATLTTINKKYNNSIIKKKNNRATAKKNSRIAPSTSTSTTAVYFDDSTIKTDTDGEISTYSGSGASSSENQSPKASRLLAEIATNCNNLVNSQESDIFVDSQDSNPPNLRDLPSATAFDEAPAQVQILIGYFMKILSEYKTSNKEKKRVFKAAASYIRFNARLMRTLDSDQVDSPDSGVGVGPSRRNQRN